MWLLELCKSEDEVMKEMEVSLDKLAVSVAAEAPQSYRRKST